MVRIASRATRKTRGGVVDRSEWRVFETEADQADAGIDVQVLSEPG